MCVVCAICQLRLIILFTETWLLVNYNLLPQMNKNLSEIQQHLSLLYTSFSFSLESDFVWLFKVFSRVLVTIDGVWIGE
jgi:hypothetical protein